jgi:hypothetical protein
MLTFPPDLSTSLLSLFTKYPIKIETVKAEDDKYEIYGSAR